jgi:hydrogenase maturation protease
VSAPETTVVVVGIGNPFRGDDGVGPAVVAAAAERLPPGARAMELDGEAARLVDAWTGFDAAVLVDAVRSGTAPPGHIHRLEVGEDDGPTLVWRAPGSSHSTGLAEAVSLARVLDRVPPRLVLFGVEGQRYDEGTALSPAVAAAVDRVVALVVAEVGELLGTGART